MKFLKLASLSFLVSLSFAGISNAQSTGKPVSFPANLKWSPMTLVGFNTGNMEIPHASRAEISLARSIWDKEIESTGPGIKPNTKSPSFILLKAFSAGNEQFVFSIFDSGFSNGCIPPANGRGIEDMYSICPMRVTQMNTTQSASQDFPEYCHLYPEPAEKPGEINQSQIAFDANTMTAYFRTIQYGKHVAACDRTLRIK